MSSKQPPSPLTAHIRVGLKLLSTERGGREGPLPAGEYRGILSARGQHFSFRCIVPPEGIALGSTVKIDIEFLIPNLWIATFKEEAEFNLWEAGTVGYGRVIKVLQRY
jgi:hypothetical protein